MLELKSIPQQSRWCTTRRLDAGHVVYNSRSDELHILNPAAHYVYELCDGARSVRDIVLLFGGAAPSPATIDPVLAVLRSLEERGIVTAAAADD